jgi:hypothetical protein
MRRSLLLICLAPACTGKSTPAGTGEPGGSDPVRVVTYNTGTSEGMNHDAAPDDGYGSEHALVSDTHYGDGLAWVPAVAATTALFAELDADIVAFQEIFWSDLCADIPVDAHTDFICERWTAGDPTVALEVLGDDWQVACHPGRPDKCLGVRRSVLEIDGCDDDFCLEGLEGARVDGCGSGARVGRARLLRDGEPWLTVVSVHGSSGITAEDQACRVAQVDQVFVDMDGEPGANGEHNLVLGDLNTDPGRFSDFDPSAVRWTTYVGDDADFRFHSDVGEQAPGSYQGVADIDHVMSDSLSGGCGVAGLDASLPSVLDAVYFDHLPIVCDLTLP